MDSSRKTVLDAIDFEIEHLRESSHASGWTAWAILPALAGLLWLLLDQLSMPVASMTVARTFFLLSLALDLLLATASAIAGKVEPERSVNRWMSARDFLDVSMSGRLDLGVAIMLGILYMWIVVRCWPDIGSVTTIVALLYFTVLLLAFAVLLIGICLGIDVRRDQDNRAWSVSAFCFCVGLGLWLLVSYGRVLMSSNPPTVIEWRVAGILVAVRILVSLLARMTRPPILLQSLVTLRRDLVFERTDATQALHKLDMIVAGMQESHRLQRVVDSVLDLLRQHKTECQAMIAESAAMKMATGKGPGKGERPITMERMKEWYSGHHASLAARAQKIAQAVSRSHRAARAITKGRPSSQALWEEIDAQVYRELDTIKEQMEEVRKSTDQLMKDLVTKEQSAKGTG